MKKIKCVNCNKILDEKEKDLNWNFGKIWFCGNSCATSWSVKQLIKYHPAIRSWTITATRECKDCEDAKRSSKEWPSIAVECHCGRKYQNGVLI